MYYYKQKLNCSACLDIDSECDCVACVKLSMRPVEVLQLGVGFFGDKAVVKEHESGNLMTVHISELMEEK